MSNDFDLTDSSDDELQPPEITGFETEVHFELGFNSYTFDREEAQEYVDDAYDEALCADGLLVDTDHFEEQVVEYARNHDGVIEAYIDGEKVYTDE